MPVSKWMKAPTHAGLLSDAYYLGVDPGKSGAAALIGDGEPILLPFKNATERDIWDWFYDHRVFFKRQTAVIERVHAMPKQGVASTFKFGQSYGFLRAMLIASEVRFNEVSPRAWQQSLGCLSKGDKNVTKAKAQQLFPMVKVTHAVADALLLAEYARSL